VTVSEIEAGVAGSSTPWKAAKTIVTVSLESEAPAVWCKVRRVVVTWKRHMLTPTRLRGAAATDLPEVAGF